ncbi:MAG: glyoxalase/bleomycin resistance/extradiol dioxygenase family protein [Flavobacterium sp.]|uniref:VOC family protein n=1 Tax=Flavobacterium sp. TaxID=239 RepID=UPI000C3C2D41|nr:VOC family protein [Flavobacterium sp.]MBF02985.1 glyoxalase/bleomycin resistance/extradiol dioxygenase family protein [Flavobacterium sp.]
MKPKIFINLPVSNLAKSMDFYSAIGFTNNKHFTDETAACMVFSEEIYVMLLTHSKFSEFTSKEIATTSKTAAAILSLELKNNQAVNEMTEKALQAGAKEPNEPKDYGFMYLRGFEDLDGHNWEIFYMDMSQMPSNG